LIKNVDIFASSSET
jgi:hypothetical protein